MKANWDPEAKGKLGKGVMSSEQQWRKTVLAADFEEKKKKKEREGKKETGKGSLLSTQDDIGVGGELPVTA